MKHIAYVCCVLLALMLGACAGATPPSSSSGQLATSSRPTAGAKPGDELLQALRPQIHSYLVRGDYLGTLRLLNKKVPSDRAALFAEEYERALRAGMRDGQKLLAKEKFREGGVCCRKILDLYPKHLTMHPSISSERFKQQLTVYSDRLMIKGLAEYRAGQLQQAITTWKSILSFDPQRSEAKKAIETTTTQLRNLKSK